MFFNHFIKDLNKLNNKFDIIIFITNLIVIIGFVLFHYNNNCYNNNC